MGVLKVNVGDAMSPDWRNIACGDIHVEDTFARAGDQAITVGPRSDGLDGWEMSGGDYRSSGSYLYKTSSGGRISTFVGSPPTVIEFDWKTTYDSVEVNWAALTDVNSVLGFQGGYWVQMNPEFGGHLIFGSDNYPGASTFLGEAWWFDFGFTWDDGNWHTTRVEWDQATNVFDFYVDGVFGKTITQTTGATHAGQFLAVRLSQTGQQLRNLTATAPPRPGRLKLWDGTQWVQERCAADDFTDDFNRSPSFTNVLTHTFTGSNGSSVGTADTGQPVIANPGWTISGNTAVDLTTVNESFLVFDSGSPDGTFEVTLTAVPTLGDGGLVVQSDGSGSNCWLLNVEAGSRYALYKRVSGGYTFVTAVARVPVAGDVLQIVYDESTGDLTPSAGGVSGSTITDSTHAAQTYIGVRASNASSAKDIAFDDLTASRVYAPIANGWTVLAGEILSGEAVGAFAREVDWAEYDLTFTVPQGINRLLNVSIGLASADRSPPAEFHLFTIGMSFGGIVQINYRNPDGTVSAYNHFTQPATVATDDRIRLRVTPTHIYAYVDDDLVEDAPLLTAFAGNWIVIDTNPTGDPASTTTVDDLTISPLGRPLKVNVGTPESPDWQTVACMTPA